MFVILLLLAAALRLWALPGIPPGPHYDEAANGTLAAEIAKGEDLPVFITSYTGKEVLFFYGVAAVMRLVGVGLLALRLTAALFGLLTVAAVVWLAYELFADDDPDGAPWLALLTAALIATSFWHVLLSRVGFRAIAQPLLQTLALAALWRGLRRDNKRCLILGGLLCGLTGHTYLAARAFPIPLALAFVALLIFDAGHRRRRLMQWLLFGLAALAAFAPLGFYFLGRPEAFVNRMDQVGPGGDWGAALGGVGKAFNMLFFKGDLYVRFNLPFRPLFGPLVACLFFLGLALTVWRLFRPRNTARSPALERTREILLLVWIPVMLLPTALAINEITPSNLRAIGLIPLIFIFPARGALHVAYFVFCIACHVLRNTKYKIQNTNHLIFLTAFSLLLGTAAITARAYFDEYAPRTDLYEASDGDLADIAQYLNLADLAGTTIYVSSIHYRHPTLAFLARTYPQIKWLVGGEVLVYPADGAALYLFPRSATPDAPWLAQHLSDATSVESPPGADGGSAFLAYRLAAPPDQRDEIMANFSGVVRLLDYKVEGASLDHGADVTVIWQVLAPPPQADLLPFYHLTDLWDSRWGQAQPFHYAAEDWTPGETVVERLHVRLAPGAPPGDYLLKVGFYAPSADARLAMVDEVGRYSGTTVPLTLTIARAESPPDPATLGMRQRLDFGQNAGLTLLGANLDTQQARPGERVYLTLFWQAGRDQSDHVVNLYLQDVGGANLSLYRGAPVHDTYPTHQWTDGEIVVDRYNPRLPLTAADAPPGDYPLALTLTDPDDEIALGSVVLGQLELIAADRTFELPLIRNTQNVTLEQFEFLGYDLDLPAAHPGGAVQLTLYWHALSEMETSYTVFTHLLAPDGSVAAQQDNLPINGTYPTTLWLPGEVIADPYTIALPSELPPGDYPIEIGLYIAENGLRLGDSILLNTVVTISP